MMRERVGSRILSRDEKQLEQCKLFYGAGPKHGILISHMAGESNCGLLEIKERECPRILEHVMWWVLPPFFFAYGT